MIKRIVDISEHAYIRLHSNQLLVEKKEETVATIPVEDIGVLILQHPAIVITQAVIVACQENNAVIIFCDLRHLPYSIVLPISEGHSLHTKVLERQTSISKPTCKQLWRQIVRHKISQQADTLKRMDIHAPALDRMVAKVKTGDSENHEAQAAQLYWRSLMGPTFRRNRDQGGINALLNYGYAIMRAMVARALVGTGLHPSLGLHHKNQYNSLCLADDMVEPFRPWIDLLVWQIAQQETEPEISKDNKQKLLGLISDTVMWRGNRMPLMVASHHMAANLKSAISGETKKLEIPTRIENT